MAIDNEELRAAIRSAIPARLDGPPPPQFIYIPAAHTQAIHPDHALVRGIRGSGKSVLWWWLQQPWVTESLSALFPAQPVPNRLLVTPGFGETPDPDMYPGRDTLTRLLGAFEPRTIWRAIATYRIGSPLLPSVDTWEARVAWVKSNPEQVERALYEADEGFVKANMLGWVLFDALDRTADSWEDRSRLLSGLLQNLLDFRGYRAIRLKAFVRPDMLVDPELRRFPDASKILNTAVDLRWTRLQLFGLLYHYLCNEPNQPAVFHDLCEVVLGERPHGDGSTFWLASRRLDEQESAQRAMFRHLAGDWMGKDKRRGDPYSWLPNHLADAHGQVSPRSFLAAARQAAEVSSADYRDHSTPLHFEAIKRGVQNASQIRVREVEEDFPWLAEVMKPLRELSVPCALEDIASAWGAARLDKTLDRELRGVQPRRSGEFAPGLLEQLIDIGVFSRLADERINMPDVYRVGFGLKRRGGVRPVR
ncbi:MAG: hypothetical protein JNJ46_11020 [Myxococcales bacterium]|nr:hypothetical protein [Myxococcales bacterium]